MSRASAAFMAVCLCTASINAETDTEASREWLLQWAEENEIASFHAEYVSLQPIAPSKSDPRPDRVMKRVGTWDLQIRPFYGQYLSYEIYDGEERTASHVLSWNLRTEVGKQYTQKHHAVAGSGDQYHFKPKAMGRVEQPSNAFFLHRRGRSFYSFLQSVDFEVRPLEDAKFGAYIAEPDSPVLLVYVVDPSQPYPIREQRVYSLSAFPAGQSALNDDMGEAIPVPPEFQSADFLVNKVVVADTRVGEHVVPTAWEVRHAVRPKGKEVTLRLKEESIRIDGPAPSHGYDFTWPPGTLVHDTFRAISYFAGSSGERVPNELITEAGLDLILKQAGVSVAEDPQEFDSRKLETVVTGCGANVLYLASRMLGTPRGLEAITKDLNLGAKKVSSSLAELERAFEQSGEPAMPVRGQADILEIAKSSPLILHVVLPTNSPNGEGPDEGHYVLVDQFDPEGRTVRLFDPPKKSYLADVDSLLESWTGNALVVGKDGVAFVREAASRRQWLTVSLAVCAAAVVAVGVWRRTSRRSRAVAASLLALVGLPACLTSCTSETSSAESPRANPQHGTVYVEGSTSADLGRVSRSRSHSSHTFTLRNRSDTRSVSVTNIRKNCRCVDVVVEPEVIEPGGAAKATLTLDTLTAWGERESSAFLVFDDPTSTVLELSVKAFVEQGYQVYVTPRHWTIDRDIPGNTVLRKRFTAREYRTEPIDPESTVSVEVSNGDVSVVEVGGWKNVGETNQGFCREFQFELEYRPSDEGHTDQSFKVSFSSSTERDDSVEVAGSRSVVETSMLLRRI